MSLDKIVWLTLSVFFLTGGVAQSQTLEKNKKELTTTTPSKESHVVDGFRSAKFGMNEKQVMQALLKDFKATKELVLRKINPAKKSRRLLIGVTDLALVGLDATIIYTLGFKSKKLTKVKIIWGRDVSSKVDNEQLHLLLNALRKHFLKKMPMQSVIIDKDFKDGSTIIFRGQDEKGRMILLVKSQSVSNKGLNLTISYIEKPPKAGKS
jgi:hypothetical protein